MTRLFGWKKTAETLNKALERESAKRIAAERDAERARKDVTSLMGYSMELAKRVSDRDAEIESLQADMYELHEMEAYKRKRLAERYIEVDGEILNRLGEAEQEAEYLRGQLSEIRAAADLALEK